MNYKNTEEKFNIYIKQCKEIIKNKFFQEKDLEGIYINKENDIQKIIRKHRLHMIDIKLEHTMRMISQIILINDKLDFHFDFKLVMKTAILYHDIGRFSQATWSNTFNDKIYQEKNKPFLNHGEEGQYIFNNNNFEVNPKYMPIIGESIKHHVDVHNTQHLQYHFTKNLNSININNIITGKMKLNEAECQVASLITQLVADIDKTDILYQLLLDDSNLIKDYVIDKSYDTLENISKYWGIDKQEIIEYNNINSKQYIPKIIRIPIKNINPTKLEVPVYMKEMFYNNTYPELNILQKDKHWHFISILWWRLSHFLNNINFYSVLITIEENNLLKQLEEKIPEKFKPLTKEAFEYAENILIQKTIKENKGNIYIKRKDVL